MKKRMTAMLLAIICLLLTLPAQAEVAVGDLVLFGVYEQDNDSATASEPIEWQVLAVEDGKALLISRYSLDSRQFNSEWTVCTWAECSLRTWLNEEFLQTAFTAEEQAALLDTLVSTPANMSYKTSGGPDVTDKLFILSVEEARQYLKSGPARKAQATPLAVEQQIFVKQTGANAGNSPWWLRSMGQGSNSAVYVKEDGNILFKGIDVDYYSNGVRPVMWVSLDALK